VNRETGAIIAISTWQDKVSAMFSREALGDVISRYTSAGARLDPLAIYEVTNTA
jgi:hypothetical protein